MSNIIKGFNHLIYAEKLNRSPKTEYVPENIERKVFHDAIWLMQNRTDVVNQMKQKGCFPGCKPDGIASVIDEYDDSEMLDISFCFNKVEYVTRFLVKKVVLDPKYTMTDKKKGEIRLKSIVLGDILYGPIMANEAPEFANTKRTWVEFRVNTSKNFNIFKEEFIDKYGYKVLADDLPNDGGFLLAHRRLHYTRVSCYGYNGHDFEVDPNLDIEDRVPNGIESKFNSRGERIYLVGEDTWISQDAINELLPVVLTFDTQKTSLENFRGSWAWNPDAVRYNCELSAEGAHRYLTMHVTPLIDEEQKINGKAIWQHAGKVVYVCKYKIEQETWDDFLECTPIKAQMVGEWWPCAGYLSYEELMKNVAQQMNEIGYDLISMDLMINHNHHSLGDLYSLKQDYQAKKIDKFPDALWYCAHVKNQRSGVKNVCYFWADTETENCSRGPAIVDAGCYGIKYLPAKLFKNEHYDKLVKEAKESGPAEKVKISKPNQSSSVDNANWWLLSHFQYLENLEGNIGEDRTFMIPAEKMVGVSTQAVINSLGSLTYKYDVISENNDGSISVHVALNLCNEDIDALDCEGEVGGEEKDLG